MMSTNPTPCFDDLCDVRAKTITISALTTRLSGVLDWIKRALSVYRQRRQLSQLSDRALSDVGIRRQDAQIECARPFWDLPGDRA